MRIKRQDNQLTTVLLFTCLLIAVALFSSANADQEAVKRTDGEEMVLNQSRNFPYVTTGDTMRQVVEHPAFRGFGRHLLPWDNRDEQLDVRLSNVRSLLPYHSHVVPEVVVAALNVMIDQVAGGQTIFYDFYTEDQKRLDPAKSNTGLFFIKGAPGAPFAVICPGGGFAYVGSLHEGFPYAAEISKRGLNAFVLKYRTGSGAKASEDLAAAVSFIFDKAEMLEVNTEGYSLWGSSAGARMVADIALNDLASYGGLDISQPGTLVIAYTGHTTYSPGFPPTFITVSADDPIANASTVDRRVNNLRNSGVTVEYLRFRRSGHGFGTGVGADAEGWVNDAIRFWRENLHKR